MRSKRQTVAFTFAVMVVSVAVAVGLAELILARQAPQPPTIPFYNELHPYVMFRPVASAAFEGEQHEMSHRQRTIRHYSSEDGFRIESPNYEIPRRKPDGQLRIAVLGGSAVELGSTYEWTLPGALRRVLRERHPMADIEVINGGIQSCVSRQSIAQLLFTVVEYEPDIVILYDGANDLGLPMTYDARSNYPYNFQTMVEAWDAYRAAAQAPLWRLALGRSRLYAAWRARFEGDSAQTTLTTVQLRRGRPPNTLDPEQVAGDPEYVQAHVAAYLSNWERLIDLSRIYDYEPICILQASGALDDQHARSTLTDAYGMEVETADDWNAALRILFREAGRQIAELARERPDRVILDLSAHLLPAEQYFWDNLHVYDEVNLDLAEDILDQAHAVIERRGAAASGESWTRRSEELSP